MRPLVLLDVDGVLNAVGPLTGDPAQGWDDWQTGRACALGRAWPIRWSPGLVARVLAWRERGEVSWLTTWGHEANRGLAPLLGLPQLPVAGTADDPEGTATSAAGDTLASVTPAAPDELTGRWWKFDVVRRVLRAEPDRPLVWLDDDLGAVPGVAAWTRAHATCLLLAPDRREGLTPGDADAVEAFLARYGS